MRGKQTIYSPCPSVYNTSLFNAKPYNTVLLSKKKHITGPYGIFRLYVGPRVILCLQPHPAAERDAARARIPRRV